MERNSCIHALILSAKNVGEDHRLISVFSKEKGFFEAMQFGGRKSKLRSMVQIFHTGKMWIYTDTVKNQTKITDFEVQNYHPSLRENLEKNWAASLCLELTKKTLCGGENEKGFNLVNAFLDGLDFCLPQETTTALLRFLWRFLALLGQQPDVNYCATCGKPLTRVGIFSLKDTNFVCSDCINNLSIESEQNIILSGEALRFLDAINRLPPKESRKITLSPNAYQLLQNVMFTLIEKITEIKLNTLNFQQIML